MYHHVTSHAGYFVIIELLDELQHNLPQTKLCDIVMNAVAYADDLTLMATSRASLMSLVDIADKYSRKWHFEFNLNPSKCAVLIYGKEKTIDQKFY